MEDHQRVKGGRRKEGREERESALLCWCVCGDATLLFSDAGTLASSGCNLGAAQPISVPDIAERMTGTNTSKGEMLPVLDVQSPGGAKPVSVPDIA
eukprot:987652-Rhodomonas_salina.3